MWKKAWQMLTAIGKFTVRSAWENIWNKEDTIQNFKDISMKWIPFKVSFFLWRLWNKRIPAGEVLIRNRICDNVVCCCCEEDIQETIGHLFVQCKF